MRASEIRELTTAEVQARLDAAREELFNLNFQRAAGQLKDQSRLKIVRRDIARYLTILNERRILERWQAMVAGHQGKASATAGTEGEQPSPAGGSQVNDEEAA